MCFLFIDIEGQTLNDNDKRRLSHQLVGGVILFGRNFSSSGQLKALAAEIKSLRSELLIAVDHEGGRVQRFQEGFTPIPAMRSLGEEWDKTPQKACHLAKNIGWVMALELRLHHIDFSFTPVLDIDYGTSTVIGNRAFHHDITAIHQLALALMEGLDIGGMPAVGKHFPGHGFVRADSHHEIPIDDRPFDEIAQNDLQVFKLLIDDGIPALMPAHVIYPQIENCPAGFSTKWLKKILRERLGFQGLIFSDDLAMAGAEFAGGIVQRVNSALSAGCDVVLICNRPDLIDEVLEKFPQGISGNSSQGINALSKMRGRLSIDSLQQIFDSSLFKQAQKDISTFNTRGL